MKMFRNDVTMKSFQKLSYKTLLRSPLISLKGVIFNKNTEFGILNGSENVPMFTLFTRVLNILIFERTHIF